MEDRAQALRARARTCGLLVITILTVLGASACGRLLHRESDLREFESSEIRPNRFRILAVVPADPSQFGPQIAYRAFRLLRDRGKTVVWIGAAYDEGPAAMARLCPQGKVASFDGVVFVTWDRITLRDCATHEIAYDIQGGYTGVDAMTGRLIRYLQSAPPGAN